MTNSNQFDWVIFYRKLAKTLLQYKDNRQDLIVKVGQIFEKTRLKQPMLEKDNCLIDIDPFTIFGLFNKSSMKEVNRRSLITAIADLFAVDAPVPKSFDSIPVLNNQNATFYYFVDKRTDSDIDNLWNLFDAALVYADAPALDNRTRLSYYFDLVIQQKGNGNSKITMGLYWIAPDVFLNLDQRNTWYVYDSGKFPADLVSSLPRIEAKISSSKYFEIVERLRAFLQEGQSALKDFKELSFEAWCYSEKVNQETQASASAENQRDKICEAIGDKDVHTKHYWIYAPGDNACRWDEFYDAGIMAIGWDEIGDLTLFSSKDAMKQKMKACIDPTLSYKNAAHATWQFANDMKPGDIVFVKRGMHHIVGRGIVTSGYKFDASRDDYKNTRRVNWIDKGEWDHPGQAVLKTLTDITVFTDYVEKLNALFEDEISEETEEVEVACPEYKAKNFLKEVYMNDGDYQILVNLLKKKKNVILQGAPGVGKTFAAKRLAYSMMGVKDSNRVGLVQFHQSYSYEDFIMGFRPTATGFEIQKGPFYNFCKKAEADMENDYFFIIDEINRGNLSKIFGELFMLIESDKRGMNLQLLYSNEQFSVPANVYVIGMMNMADRSLALLDYALRRRFAFFEFSPAFETEGFRTYRNKKNNKKFDKLIEAIERLNITIEGDDTLGRGFRIGHSYFCTEGEIDGMWLNAVVDYEIIPLLNEYWFDEPSKIQAWEHVLREAIR